MKKLSLRTKSSFLALLVFVAISVSSCNRGVGCPTNFSMNDIAGEVAEQVVDRILDR